MWQSVRVWSSLFSLGVFCFVFQKGPHTKATQLTSNSQQPCLSLTSDLVCTCLKWEPQCGEGWLSSQPLGGPARQANCT